MSCNGCRVLRKGCSETCILRPCLQWIETADAQAHATLFVAKFFGRADLMSFIAAVPSHQRPAVFQSLLFEACGRTINPVNGAVGLLTTGNWHICQSAVETVLRGGILQPIPPELLARALNAPPPRTANSDTTYALPVTVGPATTRSQPSDVTDYMQEAEGRETTSFGSEICNFENWAENDRDAAIVGQNCRKLLDLFV